MTPWIWCPRCGQQNPAPGGAADRAVRCRRCGRRFAVLAPGRPAPSPTKPPQQIGRFLIRERVGAGVFGTVYRAYDPQLQREVAVKVSRPGSLADDERRERFLREARAAARLTHPFIVPIYEIGDDGGEQYIASAFIEGPTLAAACAAGTLDCRRAALVVHDLARALGYAHKLGVVHRDVKPANVILDREGRPHLTDFGLAYRQDAGDRPTVAGVVVGTPHYLAPELVLDRRSGAEPAGDQYSLGVVLYELLCGRPPFNGVPQAVLYQAVHSQPVPPHQPRPDVSRELEAICLRAMARRPKDRYPGCDALADDLHRWLVNDTRPQPPPVTIAGLLRWCRGQPAVIAAVVFAVCLTAGVVWLASRRRDAHAQPDQARGEALSLPAAERQAEQEPGRKETRGLPKSRPDFVRKDNPVVAAPPEPPKPAPAPVPRVSGRVVAIKGQANLLLERRPDGKTWQALSADKPVSAPALLLALPGMRGTVRLGGGLEMTLWGNVREAFIPVPEYESAVLLDAAVAGSPEFTLDRGRVLVTNPTAGPLAFRVRLKDAPAAGTWDVTLEGGGAEMALEVFRLLLPRAGFPAGTPPQTELSLIVLHGEVAVKVNKSVRRALPDQGPTWFFWSSRQGGEPEMRQFPNADLQYFRKELPDTRAAGDMSLALDSLLPRLETDKPIEPLLQEMAQSPHPARRILAVYCLGALDRLPELLDCLADEGERRPDLRRTAVCALLHWLMQGDRDAELLRVLVQQKRYPEQEATTVVELLHGFTDEQLKEPATWERLILLLKSERPAVRELAYYHLIRLVPEGRRSPFDPGVSAEQRERAFGEWKKLIPDGKVPPAYAGQKAGPTR
jgi:tRNA A-37 threonylcarbamoyl transferase component Bud32